MGWTLQATAAFGLEAVVKREAEALGFGPCRIEEGHVLFSGDEETMMRANLYLSSADRVLLEIGRFPADTFEALFEGTKALPWPDFLPVDAAFPVRVRCVKSRLKSPSDGQKIVKKAIVSALEQRYHRHFFEENGARFPIDCVIRQNQAILSIDTTGEGLFKRGYREQKGGAPLKETLAAGLIDLSVWRPGRDMADVFCGSGTLLIEAARRARNIAPGIDREFLFQSWPWMKAEAFRALRRQALSEIRPDVEGRFLGADIDPRVVKIARANAEEAGVGDLVSFIVRDMREVHLPENFGVMITNPPYGKRLAPEEGVLPLMEAFASRFLSLRTWSVFVFTAMPDLEQIAQREATRRRKLFNGGVETTYYQFLGPNPDSFT